MAKFDSYILSWFIDAARGKRRPSSHMSSARADYILGLLSWAVEDIRDKRCPVCGRRFRRHYSLKNHLSNTICGKVVLEEVLRASKAFKESGGSGQSGSGGGAGRKSRG